MEHYVGTAQKAGEPEVRYPMPEGSVEGKDVLIIDDIADTGGSIERAYEYVTDRDAGEVETATLQLLQTSEFDPDFVGERLEEWTWIVYPWNFIEDMIDLVSGVMGKADEETFEVEDIRHYLAAFHSVDRIEMEIAQPDRMGEVMSEMERRGYVESADGEAWRLIDNDGIGT
jgi:hypoxanthine phosphoribosyltransferase